MAAVTLTNTDIVSSGTSAGGETLLNFSAGGQQCNRPESSHGQVLIEGVLEELDEPGEFHYDLTTRMLTLFHNASSGTPPPTDGSLEVTQLTTLINISGSQAAPVNAVQLEGLGFRDTAPALFAPHVAPTGGDWAVNRAAAVTASGIVDFSVSNATFWRLDNAGVFLGRYSRRASISDSEFAWLGESAIVSVGDTEGGNFTAFPGFGWDGTRGNQPRETMVLRNYARELGIFNKQSALYFQAATDNSTVQGNVVFNGARSGINFNDCFGSGSRVQQNIMFNLNRETAEWVNALLNRGCPLYRPLRVLSRRHCPDCLSEGMECSDTMPVLFLRI